MRRLSLMSDLEEALWHLMEEMRTEHGINPVDAYAYMSQAWGKVRSDWVREHPETPSR